MSRTDVEAVAPGAQPSSSGAGEAMIDPRRRRRLRTASLGAGAVGVLAGLLVILGSALHIPMLMSVASGWPTMKPNSALAFIAAGACLLLLRLEGGRRRWRLIA